MKTVILPVASSCNMHLVFSELVLAADMEALSDSTFLKLQAKREAKRLGRSLQNFDWLGD